MDHAEVSLKADESVASARARGALAAFDMAMANGVTGDHLFAIAQNATYLWYAYGMAVEARNALLRQEVQRLSA